MNNEKETVEREALLQKLLEAIKSPSSNVSNDEIRKILSLTQPNVANGDEVEPMSSTSSEDSEDSDKPENEPKIFNKGDKIITVHEQPTTSSTFPRIDNYPRRPGADDLGREYEIKITALVSLRCVTMKDTKEMWLGSNVDQVGDFDDIVLFKQTLEDEHFAYMVQLKHQEKPKNITQHDLTLSANTKKGKREKSKADFSLAKYSKGFVSLMNTIKNSEKNELEIIQYLRRAKRIMFVLYTNKGVNNCDFLEQFQDDVLNFLYTNDCKNNVHKFNHNKLNYDQEFLQQLILVTNQIHLNEADKLIKKEIKSFLTSSGITNVDFKKATKQFVTFIRIWAKGFEDQKDSKIFYTLTKCNILNKLIDIVLDPYKFDFSKDMFYSSCPEDNIWNKIIGDKTITVVDYDEITFAYLKSSIGSAISQYCSEPKKTWFDHLSKNTQRLFCQNFPDFNTRVISSKEEVTLFDIYKGLWFNNKLPLLLKIDNVQDYQNINKIMKLSDNNFRMVITKNKTLKLAKMKNSKHFFSLNDLNDEDKETIINLPVQLQGRSSETLKNLLDESMYKIVKCKDIVNILAKEFSVGNEYTLPNYFVERCLSKVFLQREVLNEVRDELFLIENFDLLEGNYNNVISSRKQIKKSHKKPIHHLVYYDEEYFEWLESFGSINNIRQFHQQHLYEKTYVRNKKRNYSFNIQKLWAPLEDIAKRKNSWNTTKILSANPGTGKSILMNFIARQSPLDVWVLKINLNEHEDYYKNLKNCQASDHLKNLFEEILILQNCENKDLARAVFIKFLNKKQILILLDAFDEISIVYKYEVTKIAKCFHDEGYPMWITTRPVMKLHLEQTFNTFSIGLKPFTPSDQTQYLTKYFTAISEDFKNEILENFVKELLRAAKVNLIDYDCKFTGVPLQTQLLADVFSEEYKNSLKTGVIAFNKKFDLLYLYEEFIRRKIDILCGKFGKDADRTRILFEAHQQMFSLQTVFDKRYLRKLNFKEKLDEYCQDTKHEIEIQFLQREGVVVLDQTCAEAKFKFNVNFIHQTFAEFLAGKWLAENYNSDDEKIKKNVKLLVECRFNPFECSKFVFIIFDRILAKNCNSHLAVINEQLEKIALGDVNNKDRGGRTVLQLMALYGFYHPGTNYTFLGKFEDKMANLIGEIPNNQITDTKDDILGYNVLEYAFASNSLAVANKVCEKTSDLSFNIDISLDKKERYFTYCVVLEYQALFNVLVLYFASRDILVGNKSEHIVIKSFCRPFVDDVNNNQNFNNYVDGFGVKTTSELFKFKYKDPESPFDEDYADLRVATMFGSINNVKLLVSQGCDLNQQDVDLNTPLHYAARRGCLEIIKIFLVEGAEVNKPGKYDDTALHIAARKGHNEIVGELLTTGAEINKFNHCNNTPIHFALMHGHLDTINLLLSNGASSNVETKDGETLLHYAVRQGFDEIISEVMAKNPEALNKQDHFGKTPLHVATINEQVNAVRLLVDSGANCNIQDKSGNSALHNAAAIGNNYIIKKLLNNSVIDLQNNEKETALYLASLKHLVATKLLLSNGASCNIKTQNGSSPLHNAVRRGNIDIVSELLNAGADVNSVDSFNCTPLHISTMVPYIDITKLLLVKTAEVNIKNKHNMTSLHCASWAGSVEIVSELLSKGADINAMTDYKYTPLHNALSKGHVETAQLLLSMGAQWRTANTSGHTPLHAAATIGCNVIIAQFLTDGFDVNNRTQDGDTSLHFAARCGQPDTVKLLLDHSASINVQNAFGKTPLHVSLSKVLCDDPEEYERQMSSVRLLLDEGASVNIKDEDGNTALHYACRDKYGDLVIATEYTVNYLKYFYNDAVALLLDKGADVNLKDNEGETPLNLAVKAGYESLVKILEKRITVDPPPKLDRSGTFNQTTKAKRKTKKNR